MSNLTERTISIPVGGGSMSAFLVHPNDHCGAGIVMLQEIFGVNDAMRAKAREFASNGYSVLVPDLFWRQEPNVDLGYDEESRAKGFKLMQGFDFSAGVSDVQSAFEVLTAHPSCTGQAAFVGYCIGGKLAVLAGAVTPLASAVISFYGVKLDQNIREIEEIKGPVVLHFGDNDSHIPNEVSTMLKYLFEDNPTVEVFIYSGAQHGFFNPVRSSVYDPTASKTAMARTLAALGTPNAV